jgi:hypothetical protein
MTRFLESAVVISTPDSVIVLTRLGSRALFVSCVKAKAKTILVRGRGGPQGCETSRLRHFLDSRLADGGKGSSLTRRSPFTPRKIPGYYFIFYYS